MKLSVYIETTLPSFFYETREEAEFVAMRQWSREWWEDKRAQYACFTSDAVIEELENGEHPLREEKLSLLEGLPLLEINQEIEEIVEVYLSNFLMPKDVVGDALHLAIASYHKMDYLLTWNCRHLANSNKRKHIRRINERLHLTTPEMLTPLELDDENEAE